MKREYGLKIPESVEEAIDIDRTALLVYDMQVGILRQLRHGGEIISRVADVLAVAREVGLRTCFLRHTSLPKNLMGVFQMRQALGWQRKASMTSTRGFFPGRTATPSCRSSRRAIPRRYSTSPLCFDGHTAISQAPHDLGGSRENVNAAVVSEPHLRGYLP